MDEEERVYSFASSTSHADKDQPTELILKLFEKMQKDIDQPTESTLIFFEKIQKESEANMKMELFVVTIACVFISMVTLFQLKR